MCLYFSVCVSVPVCVSFCPYACVHDGVTVAVDGSPEVGVCLRSRDVPVQSIKSLLAEAARRDVTLVFCNMRVSPASCDLDNC